MSRSRKAPVPYWRRRLLPATLALLALNLLVFFAYSLPRSLRHRSAEARAESLRQEVAREREGTAARKEQVGTVARNREELARFYREVVDTREEGMLPTLRELETLTRERSLSAGQRAYGRDEIKGTPLIRVGITVPLKGSYADLVGFLSQVERGKRFITVDRVALRPPSDGGDPAQLSVELSAFFKESGAGGNRGGG
jgi:Tfp pilus assembly protein PilO